MDLTSSKLGTQEYWENFYRLEHRNFSANPEDTGESWFSDSGAEEKVVDYVVNLGQDELSVLDLGTGNGHLLFSLREEQIGGDFLGVDYSPASVEFAKQIAKQENYDVEFSAVDFLANPGWTEKQFDVVLDKGTLDAIALSGQTYNGLLAPEQYVRSVLPRVKPGGTLLITSCNFTEQELSKLVGRPYEALEYPRFTFGGSEGSTVVSLVFQC